MSVRGAYERHGVDGFYQERGAEYTNPHMPQVAALLARWSSSAPRGARILDLCCGSGEVTRALRDVGEYQVTGLDPYTHVAYERETGLKCLRYSFAELIRGALETDPDVIASGGPVYDHIICSFAMHLCPPEELYALTYTLFKYSPELILITPHKRPDLESLTGVTLQETLIELTARGKRVTLKSYRMPDHPERLSSEMTP